MQKGLRKSVAFFKQNRKTLEPILFVCSVAYCFQATITVQVIVGAVWVLWAAIQWMTDIKAHNRNQHTEDCFFALKVFFVPQLAVHIYTMLLILFGVTSPEVLTTNIVSYTATLVVIAAIYLFEKKAVELVFWSLVLSWFYCLIKSVAAYGFGIIPDAIAQGWFGISVGHENYLELDAVVLSVGYYLVWYLFSRKETKIKSLPLAILMTIVFLVGVKRIVIVAILVLVLSYLIISKKNEARAYKTGIIAGWLAIVACVAYIFVLSLGDVFYEVLDRFGIDTMARNYFYKHMMSLTEFSPTFLGYGSGSVKLEMLRMFEPYTYVHSDIIKMFFEIGFIPFLGWLYFNLLCLPYCFKRRYGRSSAIFYLLTAAYTFVLFLTDNTESYFVCIIIRCIMPMGYALATKEMEGNCIRKL